MSALRAEPCLERDGAAEVLDATPGGRMLIIGSLPPHGRDLDLAVRRCDLGVVHAALVAAGFAHRGTQYVRFARSTAEMVDVTVLEDWNLPESELAGLLEQSRLLPGRRRLARPAPVHVLLLLAPQCLRTGSLTHRRRARLATALEEDPRAWVGAQGLAGAWQADKSLAVLRTIADGTPPSPWQRIDALAQPRGADGTGWVRAHAGALRRVLRPRKGAVVTLSGIDGAGKSSQAEALASALEQLGEDPVVVWSRVRYDPLLAAIGRAGKRVLAPVGAHHSGTISLASAPEVEGAERAAGRGSTSVARGLRDVGWAGVSAAVDGYRHLRLCAPGRRKGKIVICDRYTLDTHVHLAERFPDHRQAVRVAAWLNRRISPRPLRSYWLDVPSRTASLRKPEDVNSVRLRDHRLAYRRLYETHDVHRVDSQASAEEVAATIAADVWRALSTRSRDAGAE